MRPLITEPGEGVHLAARHEQIRLQNVRIAVAARRHHFGSSTGVPFLCECDDADCHEFVIATLSEYERIRSERLLLIAAGHLVAQTVATA